MAKITYQNYGTSILLYIEGDTHKDAHGKWMSLYNWGATASEPEWISDFTAVCWSTLSKLKDYLYNLHVTRLMKDKAYEFKGKSGGFNKLAKELAKKDFEEIPTDTFRSVNCNGMFYEMGTIKAEKPDDDFLDSVASYAFSQTNVEKHSKE